MSVLDPTVAEMAEDAERLAQIARMCATDVLESCLQWGHAPERYSDAAVCRRAERDAVSDLACDLALGHTHSTEQATQYRQGYVVGFLAAWRDPSLLRALREKRSRVGVIYVCSR